MKGRLFLEPARDLFAGPTEAHRRTAAGRAYYAAFQEARAALERWGIVLPPRDNIHAAVRLKFSYANEPEAKRIGTILEDLVKLRNEADYKLTSSGRFGDAKGASDAIDDAEDLIAILDAIESDPMKRSTVVSSIRP